MKKSVLLLTVLLSQTLWGQMRTEDNVFVDSQQPTTEVSDLDRSTSIFFEDFQNGSGSAIPSGWERYVGLLDNVLANPNSLLPYSSGGNPWQLLNPTNSQFMPGDGLDTRHATISTLTGSVKNWLTTPFITVPANSYLSIDASFNKHQSNNVPDLNGTDDKFAILYQTGNGNWTLLAKWDNQGSERVLNSIDQFPQIITLPITNTQSTSMRIAFYVESTVANTNNSIHIDNVGIWPSSGSPAPTNITVDEKSKNSALVHWDFPVGINSCKLQYKKVNDFATWSTVNSISASSYQLTGLEPETYYRVRLCSNNAQGEGYWSESIVFRTALDHDNYSIPCKEIFTSASVPTNWKVFIDPAEYALSYGGYHPKQPKPGTPASGRWSIIGGYYSFGAYHAKIYCYGSNTSWLITPNIDLSTAFHPENLSLVFDVAKTAELSNAAPPANLPDNDDEFRVLISTDGGETWLPENCITWKKNGGDHSFSEISNTGTTIRIPLDEYANGTVMIGFYCGSETGSSGFDLHIDNIFVGEANHIFLSEGSWADAGNWKDNSTPSSTDDCVLLRAAATVPANSIAQAGCISMMLDGALTIEDGGQLIHTNEGVEATIMKTINGYSNNSNGWNLICHPMSAEILADDISNLKTGTYDLYSFDIDETLEWRNFKDANNQLISLNATEGYLYANSQTKTLSFTGILNPANTMTIDDLKYNGNARLKGFNLVGNPFACNATANKPMFVMNGTHDLIISTSNYVISPNEAVFVNASNGNRTVTFTPYMPAQTSGNGNGICIEVKQTETRGHGILDRARIVFYDQDNLIKYMLNGNSTKLYIPLDGEEFALVQAEAEGEMPVNFKAEKNGNYVLCVYPENSELGYLHLIDNLTGANIDLLENPNYSFDAKTTDYASRFKLVFSTENTDEESNGFAYFDGTSLKIANDGNAMLQVIDILGHVISSETISGSFDKELNLCPGVYVLRMVSNNGVKTQKIVLQ